MRLDFICIDPERQLDRARESAIGALATLPAVLLTSSLTSHGAALQSGAASGIAIDWLHIVGATVWVGGLVSLVILLPAVRGDGISQSVLTRFGRFALIASLVVVLSGSLQAALEIGSLAGLIDSTYGQLVLVKIALLLGMLTLAAMNEWRGRRGAGLVQRGIRAELVLGVVVLAIAATLSGTPPTRSL